MTNDQGLRRLHWSLIGHWDLVIGHSRPVTRASASLRAMCSLTTGILTFAMSCAARGLFVGTSGSMAYHTISGRFGSCASWACDPSASAIAQRLSNDKRWSDDAR